MSTDDNNKVVLDSLPYIDPVNEDYEQYALALIEAEMHQTPAPRHPLLKERPLNVHSEVLKDAITRMGQEEGGAAATSSTTSAALISKRTATAPTNDSVQAWEEAFREARIAYESERLRALQLEVDKEESSQLWKNFNQTVLQPRHDEMQQQLTAQRQAVEEINHARQKEQTEVYGRQLQVFTTQYSELIVQQRQLKEAVAQLEAEVEE